MGTTGRLAAYVVGTSFRDLPEEVVQRSKEMIQNILAVTLAGSREATSQIIVRYAKQMGGTDACTLVAQNARSSPVNAALVNGTMAHVLDFDENVQRRGNHPSNAIFPVVAAVGEGLGASGRQVIEAFAIGCEVSTKVGAAGDLDEMKPTMWRHGWHLEGVACTIGAAAAASKLLSLDQVLVENAFGIATSQASGVQANYGTSTKSLHSGQAAMHGVMAAHLASDGFTGARDGLENPVGFWGCFRRDAVIDEDEFFDRLASPYDVIHPGVGFKPYPCASITHGSVGTALELVKNHDIDPDAIESVHVSCPPRQGNRREAILRPSSGLEGKFSINYCVAVAFVHGAPRMEHFTDEAVRDERVGRLIDRMEVSFDEPVSDPESRPATVTVRLHDGSVVDHTTSYPKGHPRNALTAEELDDKFMYCSDGVLTSERAQQVIAELRDLEACDDIRPLIGRLA